MLGMLNGFSLGEAWSLGFLGFKAPGDGAFFETEQELFRNILRDHPRSQ
jgi:hypothetical protein